MCNRIEGLKKVCKETEKVFGKSMFSANFTHLTIYNTITYKIIAHSFLLCN